MKPSRQATLYNPLTAPIRGLASRRTPVMMPPGSGFFEKIENLRWADDGVLSVRAGVAALATTIDSGKTPWGGASVPFEGIQGTVFLGMKDTGTSPDQTRIYYGLDLASAMAELSHAAGAAGSPFGLTRMQAVSGNDFDNPLSIAVVRDYMAEGLTAGQSKDFVIFQNGADYPRIWDDEETFLAIHRPIDPPERNNSWQALYTWEDPLGLGTDANYTVDDDAGSGWSLAETGSDPDKYAKLDVLTSGDLTISASIDSAGTQDWSGSADLIIAFKINKTAALEWLMDNLVVELIDDSSNTFKVFDPSDTAKSLFKLVKAEASVQSYVAQNDFGIVSFGKATRVESTENVYFLALPIEQAAGDIDLDEVKKVRFSLISGATNPVSAFEARIYLLAGSGRVPGGSTYEVTYRCSKSRSESYAQALRSETPTLKSLGGPSDVDVRIPFSQDLYYKAELTFQNTSLELKNQGVDRLYCYRRESGDQEALFCSAISLATLGNHDADPDTAETWKFDSGAADDSEENKIRTGEDNTSTEDRQARCPSPGAYHQCLPIGRAMISANQRLLVGASDAADSMSYARICGSRPGFPFRFTSAGVEIGDPESAFEDALPGESAVAFVASSASLIGSSSIMLFTNVGVWLINTDAIGTRGLMTRVASVGTGSPLSIVERDGRVYFVNADMRVCRLSGAGIEALSRGWVDDKLEGVPVGRRVHISAAWHQDRLHFAYTPAGGTRNTRKLVYSETVEAWESDDAMPDASGHTPSELLLTWRPGSSTVNAVEGAIGTARLIGIGSNAIPYRLESGTTDLSGDIAVAIRGGDLHFELWQGLTIRRIGVMAEAQAGKTLSTKRIFKPSNVEGTSTIALTDTNAYRWAWDGTVAKSDADKEISGNAAQIEVSGSLTGGKKILAIVFETEGRDRNPNG